MEQLEEMASFFDHRADTYEEHMIVNVMGAKEAYAEIANYIPMKEELKLIDLGCGTGLELKEIFRRNPSARVTGVDLSREMLAKLSENYPDKFLELHQMSYLDFDFGKEKYDIAVSCETMHHLSHEEKAKLYTRLFDGLVPGGRYIECDYMAKDQEEEDYYYAEKERLLQEEGIQEGIYHIDTPCTPDNQIRLLCQAGFSKVAIKMHVGNTVMLVCHK